METELKRAQSIINGLVAQRNSALDQVVNLAAEVEALQERIKELESKDEEKKEE